MSIGGCMVISEINDMSEYLSKIDTYMLNMVQFSVNPSMISSSLKKMTPLAQKSIKEITEAKKLSLILHGKYVYNFCRKDVSNQVDSLIHEIEWATQLKCDVIIHQGKNIITLKMTKLQAINNYINNLSEVIYQTNTSSSMLLLENSAGQGTELGSSLEELTYIYNQFSDEVKERIGFCIDTCHIFASGELDIRVKNDVVNFFAKFDQLIGLNKLKVIHFNDSSVPFGTKRDLHGDIMGGYISNQLLGGSCEGLKYIAQFATVHKIPLIFETPCFVKELVNEQSMFQYQIVAHWINNSILNDKETVIIQLIEQLSFDYYKMKSKKHT